MATTTNYGWTTPDDTALVKDGAAAIRTLGSSVDTTTKNLNPSTTLGDIEYRSSTANTNTRLGIGSTGQILTVAAGVPSWATPATPSAGLTLISHTTFSGVASQSINDVFSATYLNYKIIWSIDTSAASVELSMRLRISGSDNTSTNYNWARGYSGQAGAFSGTGSGASANATEFNIAASSGTRTCQVVQDICRPFATDHTSFTNLGQYFDSVSNFYGGFSHGSTSVTTSYTGFTFFPGSGDMTGAVSVYGYAK